MKSPNNGKMKPQLVISSSTEASSTNNDLHIIEFLTNRVPWEPKNYLGYYQGYRFLSTN